MDKVAVERTLVVGCIHSPYQDEQALNATLDFIKYWKPGLIILNGDLSDLNEVSKYFKRPGREQNLQDEMDETRSVLSRIRASAGKNAEIMLNWGNHEARYDVFLATKAPELLSNRDIQFEVQFGLNENNVIPNRGKKGAYARYQLGPIKVGHFEITRMHSAYTEQSLVSRLGVSVIASHSHRKGVFYKTLGDEKGTVLMGIGTGTLADETQAGMSYVENANWQKGFVIVERQMGKDRYHVTDMPIVGGNILYDGRLF